MKESVRKLVERLRGWRSNGPSSRPSAQTPAASSLPFIDGNGKSGLTVFDDLPLRFRSLTLTPETGIPTDVEDPAGIPGAFKIRAAKRTGFQRAAGTLIERRYGDRGYRIPGQQEDPYLFTFVGYDEGKLVGTVSIRLDSNEGLGADDLYKDEIDVLRGGGCRICEFTRLAVDVTAVSKPVLAGLFHTAYLYASQVHGCTFAIVEVNPRHVPFYRRALGFEPIGAERLNRKVHAPAVLLCVSFEAIAEGLKRYGGKHHLYPKERSLFPHGFSPEEEAGILERLKALETEDR